MSQPATTPVKLLLVDDLPENLLALSALLRRDGVELLEARSGSEALELLLVHPVALTLVDVQMPEMDGFELAELMRGSERTRTVPIIFVTAGASDERRIFKGYEAGAVDFLYKPIDRHILRSKVDIFVELAQQRQALARELLEKTETLRMNELFTAMLGHDLRGPLSAIVMASMLQEKKATDETARRSAARILESAKHMSRMIADMLDLARVRLAGGIPVRLQACDLRDVVQRTIDEHRIASPGHPIKLKVEGDTAGSWDVTRIAQLASNLIGNAISTATPRMASNATSTARRTTIWSSRSAMPVASTPRWCRTCSTRSAGGIRTGRKATASVSGSTSSTASRRRTAVMFRPGPMRIRRPFAYGCRVIRHNPIEHQDRTTWRFGTGTSGVASSSSKTTGPSSKS